MPKRGSLKSAGKRQESTTFLQRIFFNVALQFFACCSAAFGQNDIRTAAKPMLQCNFCSAAFRKLQRNFRFRLRHVAGVGFRGVGFRFGLAEPSLGLCIGKNEPHPQLERTTCLVIPGESQGGAAVKRILLTILSL